MKTLRDCSRQDWTTPSGEIAHTNAGSLQRIADATEKIALNYESLLHERKMACDSRDYWKARAMTWERRCRGLRGHITRLKGAK